ncbi:hypothetical protein RN001_010598 [Aquatica leii]|uniref:Peptidase S1 domain-containing protein n=1 Tax=Aquatica leii TaxID=1421715 RepID=A0AAN7PWK1_9COLE|nr:hypothetical protein RN001_010598 [Aquatica leii]
MHIFLVSLLFFTAAEETRIVNGATASNEQYLYQASLRNLTNVHFCGASVLNTRWVLTSARCLSLYTNFTVVVGTHDLTTGGVTYQVETYTKHPSYDPANLSYDAGIVKTLTTIVYSSTVRSIVLAPTIPMAGTIGAVTGWGYTTYPSTTFSNQLQVLNTKLISQTECQKQFSNLSYVLPTYSNLRV